MVAHIAIQGEGSGCFPSYLLERGGVYILGAAKIYVILDRLIPGPRLSFNRSNPTSPSGKNGEVPFLSSPHYWPTSCALSRHSRVS